MPIVAKLWICKYTPVTSLHKTYLYLPDMICLGVVELIVKDFIPVSTTIPISIAMK